MLRPYTTGGMTSIGFYNNNSVCTNLAGDSWFMGKGLGYEQNRFSIKTYEKLDCLTIDPNGSVNIPYSLSIKGVDLINDTLKNYYPTFYIDTFLYNKIQIDDKLAELIQTINGNNTLTAVDSSKGINQLVIKSNTYNIAEIDQNAASFYTTISSNGLTVNGISTCNGSLNVKSESFYGNIHVAPNTENAETGIGFFRHTNRAVFSAGDCWFIGNNLFNDSLGCFQSLQITLENVLKLIQ